MSSEESSRNIQPKSIVIVGGGVQGTSISYQIYKRFSSSSQSSVDDNNKLKSSSCATIHILEAKEVASAASGKGGGFMAKTWGDGDSTQQLHHLSFDMYEDISKEIDCKSYRKLPVLSVAPGRNGKAIQQAKKNYARGNSSSIIPSWLDGNTGRINVMGEGNDTAQITPKEFVTKMIETMTKNSSKSCGCEVKVVLGECIGVETTTKSTTSIDHVITGVKYIDRTTKEQHILKADCVVISCGPWSCQAEDWFHESGIELPMEGVKSTSIVWKPPPSSSSKTSTARSNDDDDDTDENVVVVDATALFCGEDSRFHTHLEVYPRPDNTIYICGIGGSDYVTHEELKSGAYREICEAKQSRVEIATKSFREISSTYRQDGCELDKVQSCMRPCPPDAKPYMGKIPGYQGAYINAGHNCWGIAWAPACGKAMSELILDGQSKCIDLSPFDPTRFSTNLQKQGGGRGRKRQGLSVGEQW